MQETWVPFLGQEDPLEKGMATYSSILACKIPWTEESGGLQSMQSQRVRHDWAVSPQCLVWHCLVGNDFWVSLVAQMVKNLPAVQETWVRSLGWEDPLEKGTAPHSSILAWRIPWTEEPGRLQSMGSQRVTHYWATFMHKASGSAGGRRDGSFSGWA